MVQLLRAVFNGMLEILKRKTIFFKIYLFISYLQALSVSLLICLVQITLCDASAVAITVKLVS